MPFTFQTNRELKELSSFLRLSSIKYPDWILASPLIIYNSTTLSPFHLTPQWNVLLAVTGVGLFSMSVKTTIWVPQEQLLIKGAWVVPSLDILQFLPKKFFRLQGLVLCWKVLDNLRKHFPYQYKSSIVAVKNKLFTVPYMSHHQDCYMSRLQVAFPGKTTQHVTTADCFLSVQIENANFYFL